MSGSDLATALEQGTVSVEQQLRIVQAAAIPFIDADRHHHARPSRSLADCVGRRGRHRHRLIEQSQMLGSAEILQWRLHHGKIRVVRHDGFRKGGQLSPLLTKLVDLPRDSFDRSLATIQHRADLDRRGFDNLHGELPFLV